MEVCPLENKSLLVHKVDLVIPVLVTYFPLDFYASARTIVWQLEATTMSHQQNTWSWQSLEPVQCRKNVIASHGTECWLNSFEILKYWQIYCPEFYETNKAQGTGFSINSTRKSQNSHNCKTETLIGSDAFLVHWAETSGLFKSNFWLTKKVVCVIWY